jgi:hypothetical protein
MDMISKQSISTLAFALTASSLLSSCAPDVATVEQMPAASPASAVGTATGAGKMKLYIWSKDPATPPQNKMVDFAPKFAYAYPETVAGERTLWIVVSDQSPDTGVLNNGDDRARTLDMWCGDKHAMFQALQLDSRDAPMASRGCGGDGRPNVAQLSADSTMGDRGRADLKTNDGKRIDGSMAIGLGMGGSNDGAGSFAETTGDYTFATDIAPLTLRDRVAATGDEHASGIPGAKAALQNYWKTAGSANKAEELFALFTPERHAQAVAQNAELVAASPEFATRMFDNFKEEHAKSITITGAKAIGAAAVVNFDMPLGDTKMNCQTLMLQFEGAWKVGSETCKVAAKS